MGILTLTMTDNASVVFGSSWDSSYLSGDIERGLRNVAVTFDTCSRHW